MERSIAKEIEKLFYQVGHYIANENDPRKEFNQTQYQIVDYLMRHEGEDVCQKDLEIETGLKKASITGTIDALAAKDIVYREQSAQDKRKNFVRLTEFSLSRKELFEKRVREVDESITEGVSETELQTFYTVIDKIRANIEKAE